MIVTSIVAIVALRLLIVASPGHHPVTTSELLLSAFIVLMGLPGIGMLVEGPAIFGRVDRPRRR